MWASSLILGVTIPIVAFAIVSPDATCGGEKGYTCVGSKWGNCCSQYGWCGRTSTYCNIGKGCQAAFGTCSGLTSSAKPSSSSRATLSTGFRTSTISRSSTAAKPSSTQSVSTNARCGPSYGGKTCLGSKWGNCCSQYSYCGSTIDYCAAETCQKDFGFCNVVFSSSSSAFSSFPQLSNTPTVLSASSSGLNSAAASSTAATSSLTSSSATIQSLLSSDTPSSVTGSSSIASTIIPSTSALPSSPVATSASASASPLPQLTCGALGNRRETGPVTYYDAPAQSEQRYCKNYCSVYRNCYAYGYNKATLACVFALSTTKSAFDQAFMPAADGSLQWYALSCDATASAASSSSVASSSSAVSSSSKLDPTPSSTSDLASSSLNTSSATPMPSSIIATSTVSATISPSAASATPSVQDPCGVKGTSKFISGLNMATLPSSSDFFVCRNACNTFNSSGGRCSVFAIHPVSNICYLLYGTVEFTLAQIVNPNPASVVTYYDLTCAMSTGRTSTS